MLISTADKDTPDPQLENFDTGKVRTIKVEDNEGGAYAAHVVIPLDSLKGKDYLHPFMLERVPGISAHYAKLFLNSEIKEIFDNMFTDVNGDRKKYRCIIELDGMVSDTIGEALKTGTLKGLSFVKHSVVQDGHDEDDYVEETTNQVSLKIKKGLTRDGARGILTRCFDKYKRAHFEEAVIRITTDRGTKSTAIDLSKTADIFEQGFFQQEKIDDFSEALEQSPSIIRDDIVEKMLSI